MESRDAIIKIGESEIELRKSDRMLAIITRYMGVQDGAVYLTKKQLAELCEFLSEDGNERKE
jgi:hypothetical protein